MNFCISNQKQNVIVNALNERVNSFYSNCKKVRIKDYLTPTYTTFVFDVSKKIGVDTTKDLDGLTESDLGLIKDYFEKLPEIHLILSFEPTMSFIEKIEDDLSEKLKDDSVLKIRIDQSIIAGVIIEHQGKSYDYSLEQYINKINL